MCTIKSEFPLLSACKKAEEEFPKELAYDEIPCDYCKNMDCMNCKYVNGF